MKGFDCVCIHDWSLYTLGSTFAICQQSFSFQFCPFLEERNKVGMLWNLNAVCFLCHTVPAVRQRSQTFSPSDGHKPFYIRSFQVTVTKPTYKQNDLSQWTELAQKYSWVGEHLEIDLKMLHAREKGEHLIETSGFNLSRFYRHASIWIHMCLPCGRVCTSQNPKKITFKAFFFRGRKGQNIHILIAHIWRGKSSDFLIRIYGGWYP